MSETESRYIVEQGVTVIELRLHSVDQLFNSLDPAPFHEKDLDADAEDYIVGAVDDFPMSAELKLVIYLPEEQRAGIGALGVPDAIHNYFTYAAEESRRRLRLIFREGRTSLGIGLAFLVFCVSLREIVSSLDIGAFREVLAEGLLISGWVAMWRPIHLFLYGWWPERHRREVRQKLAAIPIEVRGPRPPPLAMN